MMNRTAALLAPLGDERLSDWFCIPFGDAADFDAVTARCVVEAGYQGVLLSRGRAHRGPVRVHGARAVERFMPPARVDAFWPGAFHRGER